MELSRRVYARRILRVVTVDTSVRYDEHQTYVHQHIFLCLYSASSVHEQSCTTPLCLACSCVAAAAGKGRGGAIDSARQPKAIMQKGLLDAQPIDKTRETSEESESTRGERER